MPRGVVGLEHGVEDPLQEADLVGGVDGGELGQVVAGGVDQGVGAEAGRLVECAADFEVEGGDGVVGGGDEVVEVGFRDVFFEIFAFFCVYVSG